MYYILRKLLNRIRPDLGWGNKLGSCHKFSRFATGDDNIIDGLQYYMQSEKDQVQEVEIQFALMLYLLVAVMVVIAAPANMPVTCPQ